MQTKVWKDVKGYDGCYQVNDFGEVKNLLRVVKSGDGNRRVKERMLKKINSSSGYFMYHLSKYGKMRLQRAHRLVAEAFIPNPENKPCVNHKNGIKTDNRVCNLEWVTHSENTRHAYKTGLRGKGENNPLSKLTEKEVKEIRSSYKRGMGIILAEKHNVSRALISNIVNNKIRINFE